MGTKCFFSFAVVFTAVVAIGYCENEPKFKRSLISRFTSNPLFHKFFHTDDYHQPPVYTSVTRGENYGDYQEPVYTDSWQENYEYSYITPEEAYEEPDNNNDEIYEEKDDNAQFDTRFSEDDNDNKIATTAQRHNFFNTLPLYESEAFQNRRKNKHEEAHGTTEEERSESNTRSDIRFDEDEQDDEDNRPLFNSLPFYETAVMFSNNELSKEITKLMAENEHEEEDKNQILFNILPYYEVAKLFRIPEDSNETPEKKVEVRFKDITKHRVSNEDLKSEDVNLVNKKNEDFIKSNPIENVFVTSIPIGDGFVTSASVAPVFVSRLNPALDENIVDDRTYVFNSLPLYDNIGLYFNKWSHPNEISRNVTNEINSDVYNVHKNEESHNSLEKMSETSQRTEENTRKEQEKITETEIYIFKSLPYFDRSLPFYSGDNTLETTKEEQMATQMVPKAEQGNKIPNDERKDHSIVDSVKYVNEASERPEQKVEVHFKDITNEASNKGLKSEDAIENDSVTSESIGDGFVTSAPVTFHRNPAFVYRFNQALEENIEHDRTSTEENTRKEQEEITGTQIYIFKSLPYFDRSLPFSSANNTFESTKEEETATRVVPKASEGRNKMPNDERKKLRGRRKKVKKVLVARRHRNNLAAKKNDKSLQGPADLQTTLAFGDRIKRKINVDDYQQHAGLLPLEADTHPKYKVNSFGKKLHFTYDLNVEKQLYNNLINKTKS